LLTYLAFGGNGATIKRYNDFRRVIGNPCWRLEAAYLEAAYIRNGRHRAALLPFNRKVQGSSPCPGAKTWGGAWNLQIFHRLADATIVALTKDDDITAAAAAGLGSIEVTLTLVRCPL